MRAVWEKRLKRLHLFNPNQHTAKRAFFSSSFPAAPMSYETPYVAAGGGPARPANPQSVLQQQDNVIRQQDESLDQLGRSVATLHRMGGEIHGELLHQNQLLDDLERGVDQTRNALVSQNSRMQRLIQRTRKNCWWMVAIILLIVALVVVLYFVITS